ncbi:MAG: hypothetical protein MI741_09820, partial [Rhodospirillales bacterium]|nr:hypothetical protein [Rhodospirillales bacterium]
MLSSLVSSNPLLQMKLTGPLSPGERLIQAAMHQRYHREMQSIIWAKDPGSRSVDAMPQQPAELYFTGRFDELRPQDVFDNLRWGGRIVIAGPDENDIARLASKFNSDTGYRLEQ